MVPFEEGLETMVDWVFRLRDFAFGPLFDVEEGDFDDKYDAEDRGVVFEADWKGE